MGSFLKKEKTRLAFGLLIFILGAVFLWLRPLDAKPFDGMSDEKIINLVSDDLYRSVSAMDYLETSGNDLLEVLSEANSDNNGTEDIDYHFSTFLEAVAYSESLTETHRYFASIPYRLWNQRITSFLISYSLYVKKYELVHRVMVEVSGDEHKSKALNQFNRNFQKPNIYNEMVVRFYSPKTRVRLTGGHFYQKFFIGDTPREEDSFLLLRDKAYGSYGYLLSNFGQTVLESPKVLGDGVEQEMFDTWFPVQKTVASTMGKAILSTRGNEGLIDGADALVMEKVMLPGDIMLQRRNWHVSNVGIPGFWTHSALYTGDLSTMDKYFASEFPYEGHESFSALIESKFPSLYEVYITDLDNPPAVIEAIEPGVILQTLTKSADADYVAVLRPNLSKKDKLMALEKAFSNFGKPYDFNFDFDTRDALACSELVYDAYFERLPEKLGLHMETSEVNGRKIVSPFDMAKKYVNEKDSDQQELTFVYLLMSDEKTKEVSLGTEKDFVESLEWSKFSSFAR